MDMVLIFVAGMGVGATLFGLYHVKIVEDFKHEAAVLRSKLLNAEQTVSAYMKKHL